MTVFHNKDLRMFKVIGPDSVCRTIMYLTYVCLFSLSLIRMPDKSARSMILVKIDLNAIFNKQSWHISGESEE